jgi:glutamate--cysteine ligase
MVPHLTTALTGPINELEQRMLESLPAIERWFRLEWMEHTPPFYSGVDIRNAGFKLAPVDTDLFPDGFNNLSPAMLPLAVQAAMAAIEKICPEARNLLLVAGPHTDNSFYLTHLQRLIQIFRQAGLNVRVGALPDQLQQAVNVNLPDGEELRLEPVLRQRGRLGLKDFDPCTILLNNDLAAGTPALLQGIHEQYLLPPVHAGWGLRRKSKHFASYEEVAKKFAKLLGMDPWLIHPLYGACGPGGLETPQGLAAAKEQVDSVLGKLRRKYKEYGINERPFVVVKADNGSQGLGLSSVRDAKELDDADGPVRLQMRQTRLDQEVSGLIVQEGVPTCERVNQALAEPVVYMIDRYVVGGFYRVHAQRRADENLNAPGQVFVPLAFAEAAQLPKPGVKPGASAPNRFYMYGVVGRLAMLAAAYELEATDPQAEIYE